MQSLPVDEVVEALTDAVDGFQSLDLDTLTAKESMALTRAAERLLRRVHAGTDRLAGHLDETGKHGVDGHKTAKAAVTHLGRVSGAEAFGRVRTARCWKLLPAVAAAYERGEIPVEMMRTIARLSANPRVQPFLDDVMDKIIAEQASSDAHGSFTTWLRDVEAAADPDGAAAGNDTDHANRHAQFNTNDLDGSWELRAHGGAAQGAVIEEIYAAFEAAEWEADRQEAIAVHGPHATPDQFRRTPGQRRLDALVNIFRMAFATPPGAQAPEPVVNIIVDADTLEEELQRAAGTAAPVADDRRIDEIADGRICRTLRGRPIHPSDVLAALLVGSVRRVVVDAASNVIDLGRRRRLFTGSSRDAVRLQAAIRRRHGTTCLWSGCHSPPHRQQCDHVDPHGHGGRTDVDNGELACGFHNRLKETGFRPVRRPDGGYDLYRPDGTKITPPA